MNKVTMILISLTVGVSVFCIIFDVIQNYPVVLEFLSGDPDDTVMCTLLSFLGGIISMMPTYAWLERRAN